MSDEMLLMGVSARTLGELAGTLKPRVHLVVIDDDDPRLGSPHATAVEVIWRRQWDRTSWVTTALGLLPAVRWLHTDTAGVDRFPLALLAERQVLLTNARGAHTPAVAEWALAAMLLAAKGLGQTVAESMARSWSPRRDGLQLRGRAVVILGLGDIGRYLAGLCSALGMRVLGVSRSGAPVAGTERVVSSSMPWLELLEDATFLVNCLPLTSETHDLVDLSVLSGLGAPGWLINVGRGETVVESDVVTALHSGLLSGAVLDTVRSEPLHQDSELWSCPGIVISPHVSSFTDVTEARTRAVFVDELARYLQRLELRNVIDLERGY